MHNAEPHALPSWPNIIKNLKLRWAGDVACMELSGNAYRVLVEVLRETDL